MRLIVEGSEKIRSFDQAKDADTAVGEGIRVLERYLMSHLLVKRAQKIYLLRISMIDTFDIFL